MPSINDRIGSQNVIRVLSNASAPPTKLVNMNDVQTTRKSEDGLILVWDSGSEKFVLTDIIDAATIIQTGISSISNTTDSSSSITGALTVAGGVGISKNLTLGSGFVVAGVGTFTSNIDANASVDIFRDLRVNNNLSVAGVSTFTGITTTVGDLYVGGDLYLQDDLVLDNITGDSLNITGNSIVNTLSAVSITSSGNVNISGITTLAGNVNATSNVNISGITTLASSGGITTTGGDLYVGGDLYIKKDLTFDEFTARAGVFTEQLTSVRLNITGVTTFQGNVSLLDNDKLTFGGAGPGASGSLHIYHNGSDSYIDDVAIGNLILRASGFAFKTPSDEIYLQGTPNADVKLFHDNVNRVETTNYGAKVTGILSATSITADTISINQIDGGTY